MLQLTFSIISVALRRSSPQLVIPLFFRSNDLFSVVVAVSASVVRSLINGLAYCRRSRLSIPYPLFASVSVESLLLLLFSRPPEHTVPVVVLVVLRRALLQQWASVNHHRLSGSSISVFRYLSKGFFRSLIARDRL